MSNVTLSMLVTAKDDASGVFRRVGSAAGDVDKAHGRMARSAAVAKTAMAGLGIAAAGAAVYFAKDSVQAYAEAEQSQLRLQAAYRKFPALANFGINALRQYNSTMQTKTIYDDDDLAMMQSRLAAFRLTGQQLREVTPLVADLATATGKDVVTAGESFGKALMGNTRALKAIGINYTMTGDRAKDYAAIVDRVRRKVGGLAQVEGKSAAGQLKILENLFGELQEQTGKALMPGLRELVKMLKESMPGIQAAIKEAMPALRDGFKDAAAAARDLKESTQQAGQAVSDLPDPIKEAAAELASLTVDWDNWQSKLGLSSEFDWLSGPGGMALHEIWNKIFGDAEEEANKAREAIDGVKRALRGVTNVVDGAARSQKDYKQALSNSTKIAKHTEAGIKGHTQAANRNRMALFQQAAAGQGVLANMKKMGASSAAVTRTQRQLGQSFVKVARDMGVPKGQARDLARAYGLLPPKKSTKVDAPGATKSKRDIDAHNKAADKMPNKKSTKVDAPGADRSKSLIDRVTSAAKNMEGTYTATVQQQGAEGSISAIQAVGNALSTLDGQISTVWTVHKSRTENAAGGRITGPGTETSDSIPAMLSHNEYVIRASSAKRIGFDRLAYINATGSLPGFASGGAVNIGSKRVGADDDRDYTAAEKAEINRAIAAGDKERADDIRKRRRRKGESQKSYDRRIRGMDNFRERVDAARSAKAQAQAIVDRRKARAAEKKALADEKRRAFADAIREHNDSARSTYDQYASEASGGVRAGLDSIRGFASVSGFDLSASAQAQEELAMARASVNGAGSADERRNALEAVKAAQLKVNATAANGTNVTAWMNKKLNIVKGFKKALDNLKSRGLNATTLSEVAQMDPESGTQIANALAGSNLTQINSLQDQILTEGGSYGKLVHNAGMDADAQASKVVANIVQGGGVKTTVNVNSKLFLDGQELYKSLLRVERQTGKQLFVTRSR